ncbi:MAG: hypothetical protein EXR50_01805 [Dehalococcoidia bacterium]|nr:hypothetical protein [Dehalococcoidia bacterium]
MRKTHKYLLKAAQEYYEELVKHCPDVEIDEVMAERHAGADMWIALKAPIELVDDVLDAAVKLKFKWFDERGLSILVTVSGKPSPVVA